MTNACCRRDLGLRLQLCPACLTRCSGDDDRAEPVEEINSILTAYGELFNSDHIREIGQRERSEGLRRRLVIPEGIVHALRNDYGMAPGTGVRGWPLSYNMMSRMQHSTHCDTADPSQGGAEMFLVFVCEILTEPDHLENEEAKSLASAAGNRPYIG